MFKLVRPVTMAAACLALTVGACAQHQQRSSSALPKTASAEDMDRPAMPPHRQQGQSASAGDVMYQPAQAAPPSSNLPGSGTAPGTTKALAPGQGTMTRSTARLTDYQLHQGTNANDLKVTQAIHRAMENDERLPADGAAVTIITHGGNAVLFGTVPDEAQREVIEQLARHHAASVESHIVVSAVDAED
jgi:hypothetical protein